MTSTTSQAPAPPAAGGPGDPDRRTITGRLRQGATSMREGFSGTPGRLRLFAVLGVLAGILVGLSAGQAFRVSAHALQAADVNATQVIRVQEITTDLVRSDAAATNAFLVGGLEPVEQRQIYTAGMAEATEQLAQAARAQPADANALGALNRAITEYAGAVEQARANNRQGLPLGAAYLKVASATLRTDALPVLDSLVSANTGRVESELDAAQWAMAWVVVGGLIALGVLVGISWWLARRTHRYLNLPIVLAAGITLGAFVVGGLALYSAGKTARDVRDGPYAAALSVSTARVDAFDAKANESLTLIARGSGAAFETAWQQRAQQVEAELSSEALIANVSVDSRDQWAAYAAVHDKIRKADDGGDWEGAVALATGEKVVGSSREAPAVNANTTFAEFDKASAAQLSEAAGDATSQLTKPVNGLRLFGWLAVLAGLIAALAAWWGVAARLEEYR
jgi:CHASE3 domain sensor protein